MRRTRKLFMVGLACAGMVMALLLTAALTTHLLANRDMVRAFIVAKTAQATGGELVYDRLDISFLPIPHLKARDIHLQKKGAFDVTARELSVYPRLLPLLKGQVSIRRLALATPEVKVFMDSGPMKASDSPRRVSGRPSAAFLASCPPSTRERIFGSRKERLPWRSPRLRIFGSAASMPRRKMTAATCH
jgi:hypothetical protein